MQVSNYVELVILAIIILALVGGVMGMRRYLKRYDGYCGVNHGDQDPHRYDHIL